MRILDRLLLALDEITPAQLAQVLNSFTAVEDGEKIYGVVQSEYARRLWTVAHRYEREARMYVHAAKFDAANAEEVRVYLKLHSMAHALEEIARDLAWGEIRNELDAWEGDSITLRADFTLVETVPKAQVMDGLISIPLEVIRALKDAAKAAQEEHEQKKRKPQ